MNGLASRQTKITSLSETFSSWQIPPANLKLKDNDVQVWLAQLDQENTTEFEQIISEDERIRANRFRFETHRKQFIVGRGLLRKILAKYLHTTPSQIRFEYNLHGKPFFGEKSLSGIKFNLSHSANLALYAITSNQEVGIDLELINPSFVDAGMISLCLTQRERAHFYSLSEEARNLFFFDCWTRKEAYLKAFGCGLTLSPNEIETSNLSQFQLSFPKLPAIDKYATALAVEGNNPQLKFWFQHNP